MKETRIVEIVKSLRICLDVSTQYERVTETDGQTDIFPRHNPRLCTARCGINKIKNIIFRKVVII